MQRLLEDEVFDKWDEGCHVMEAKRIPVTKIPEFLDQMQDTYEGMYIGTLTEKRFIIYDSEVHSRCSA